jgi:hypothetical protein
MNKSSSFCKASLDAYSTSAVQYLRAHHMTSYLKRCGTFTPLTMDATQLSMCGLAHVERPVASST